MSRCYPVEILFVIKDATMNKSSLTSLKNLKSFRLLFSNCMFSIYKDNHFY